MPCTLQKQTNKETQQILTLAVENEAAGGLCLFGEVRHPPASPIGAKKNTKKSFIKDSLKNIPEIAQAVQFGARKIGICSMPILLHTWSMGKKIIQITHAVNTYLALA